MWRFSFRSLLAIGLLPLVVGVSSPAISNIPEACPALPEGAPLIAQLASGQAIASDASLTLRLSSSQFVCGEWSNVVSGADCLDSWNLTVRVPLRAMAPGTHRLSEIGTDFGDLFVQTEPADGCSGHACRTSVKGIGSTRLVDEEATLQIHAVTDTCITGRLTGVKNPYHADAPDYNGAFFALRCP
jgi:hypothetical protein